MNSFTIKVDLKKNISVFSCQKCSIDIREMRHIKSNFFLIKCPKCGAEESYKKRNKKDPKNIIQKLLKKDKEE